MSVIRLNNVSKSYDGAPVLREVFFRLSEGERVGLIGKNGAGKTTLLKLILGQESPSEGAVEVDDGTKIGYFSQFSELNGEQTITEVLDALFAEVHTLEAMLAEVDAALATQPSAAEMDRLLLRQANLLEEMERREGWDYHYKIDTVLTRLGFSDAHRTCPIDQLSGGWRNRAALAKILLEAPDVLLMDEPTNFLDMEGLAWLEEWFRTFRGALIVVSHDRQFLDRVVNCIIEIENYHFQEYRGNYTQYIREKPLRLKTLTRQFEYEEELLALEAEAISDREEAARNPSRALKRRLANIKKQTQPRAVDTIITNIYDRLYVANDLCHVESASKTYGGQRLFHDLTFDIHREDRIAVVGPNGCGKTTLLRALTEAVKLDAGRVAWSKGAAFVYYNQVFDELDLNDTVTHAVNVTGLAYLAPRKQVNRFLALMQFSEMDLTQRIGALSGGQRARVALAKSLLSGASAIILDEPTNHLDITSAQVMERALLHFPGAVVVVSHDRFFIDKVATRLLVFEGAGVVREVNGNWTMWQSKTDL
ncbi:MAG TPA: ABC-F family ATP-binding cassette domain-containing protein [Anaerolineae bacterium]|nr:ABC-F family ATP-binding cassette domain-containing protein [Anaerolineae bacterium]HQI83686.1 ABC-F family ATP-binding cassette domain-containing protein [Anaerolineae bacterium]